MSVQVQNHPSVKVIIPGVSGTGKTTLWEKLISREDADFYFLFDHKQGDLARRFDLKPCRAISECDAALKAQSPVIVYDPGRDFPGEPEKGFSEFSKFVWNFCQRTKGRKIFGTDELDWLIDPRNVPADFLAILDQGRTFQIDIFVIAQSMNALHNGVRKQFTEIFAFRQGDKTGLPYLTEKGFDGNELLNLKNGEWIYKNVVTGKTQRGGTAFAPNNSGRNLKGL